MADRARIKNQGAFLATRRNAVVSQSNYDKGIVVGAMADGARLRYQLRTSPSPEATVIDEGYVDR